MSEWDLMDTYEPSSMIVRRLSDLLVATSGFCKSKAMESGRSLAISGTTQREQHSLSYSCLALS